MPTTHTVYTYSQIPLWLAYGQAIGSAAVTVITGYAALLRNGASFSNDFSTTLRTTRSAHLSVELKNPDTAGHDPLPKYIADAKVRFRNCKGSDLVYDGAAEKLSSVSTETKSGVVSASTSLLGPSPSESSTEQQGHLESPDRRDHAPRASDT